MYLTPSMKAYQRLEDIEYWLDDAFSKNGYDQSVPWKQYDAIKFDMQGAIHASYNSEDLWPIYGLLYSQPETCDLKSLAWYNREWGWQGVYNFLKRLDI